MLSAPNSTRGSPPTRSRKSNVCPAGYRLDGPEPRWLGAANNNRQPVYAVLISRAHPDEQCNSSGHLASWRQGVWVDAGTPDAAGLLACWPAGLWAIRDLRPIVSILQCARDTGIFGRPQRHRSKALSFQHLSTVSVDKSVEPRTRTTRAPTPSRTRRSPPFQKGSSC